MAAPGDLTAAPPVLTERPRIPAERLALAERMYLRGKPRTSITSALCRKYDVSARTARR